MPSPTHPVPPQQNPVERVGTIDVIREDLSRSFIEATRNDIIDLQGLPQAIIEMLTAAPSCIRPDLIRQIESEMEGGQDLIRRGLRLQGGSLIDWIDAFDRKTARDRIFSSERMTVLTRLLGGEASV